MSQPLAGDVVRHHNQPFYARPQAPTFFWAGCLGPVIIIGLIGFFIARGATSSAGIDIIRGFLLFAVVYIVIQAIFGGSLFARSRSSLAKGLLIGAGVMILLLVLGFIGLITVLGSLLT